jgi:aminopeptidase N
MLQLMMRESGANADANFIAIMRDFVKTYAGKNPSTRDFQTVVERHMVPNMNGGGDGKMDWFFRQWVYGTEIPRYREKLAVAKSGDGQYHITGSVSQEGVSTDFRALTHLYLDYGKGEIAHLGLLPMIGSSTRPVDVTVKLAKAPKRAFLNANHDVLARD